MRKDIWGGRMKKIIDEYIRLVMEHWEKDQSREMRDILNKQSMEIGNVLEIALGYDLVGLIAEMARYCERTDTDSSKIYECLAVMGYEVEE